MNFVFEALTAEGRLVSDQLESPSAGDAAESLRGKGLTVMKLAPVAESPDRPARRGWLDRRGMSGREVMVFTRQMKMLLDAGSTVVPALEAVESQSRRPGSRDVFRKLREHVEGGGALAEALSRQPNVFPPVFRAMVAAGESTATLSSSFSRLSEMSERQQKARKAVIGALLYPAILVVMCTAVILVLLLFVVPRFRDLFVQLNAPLPFSTEIMMSASAAIITYWPAVVSALLGGVAICVAALRQEWLRRSLDELVLRAPFVGAIYARLLVARVLRVWAAMLRSHVPLLETIRLSQSALTNATILAVIRNVEDSIAAGGRIGRTLGATRLVEPVVASAIATGEENGRLAEAVEFVSNWMDDDNAQLVAGATRVVEPLMLAVMGGVVGLVAMSLFLPLFDMATAGH